MKNTYSNPISDKLRILGAAAALIFAQFFQGQELRAQEPAAPHTCSLGLGEAALHVLIHGEPEAAVHFLNLHDDENTSVEAALDLIGRKGGALTELRHTGERLVSFRLEGKNYQADPNRIFTQAGRRATLSRYGQSNQGAEKALAQFADSLLELYGADTRPCILTLHNNTEGNFSVKSYLKGAIYENDARKVHIQTGWDEDDFVLVTTGRLYRFFKRKGLNVVLQSRRPSDDGSLSVYAARKKIPYINIEAQEGHLEEQKKMIAYCYELSFSRQTRR